MATDAVNRWALINGYNDDEVVYNLTEWHGVDTAVFSKFYDRLLEQTKPECKTCPQVGLLAVTVAKGAVGAEEADEVLARTQPDCEGTTVFEDDWNAIDGDQLFVACKSYEKFTAIKSFGI